MSWTQLQEETSDGLTTTVKGMQLDTNMVIVRTTITRNKDSVNIHDSTAVASNAQVVGGNLVAIQVPVDVQQSVPVPLA